MPESSDHSDEGPEPQILAKLQGELLKPVAADYIVKSVEREIRKALSRPKDRRRSTQRLLDEERRKLQNLITVIEGGSDAPVTLLKAIKEREGSVKRLEAQLKADTQKPLTRSPQDIAPWVREQLQDITKLLKSDPLKVKSEFRRLNLKLTFNPVEAKPRPHYVVNGQCDLSALVIFYLRSRFQSAVLDYSREQLALISVIYFGGVITFFAVAARRSSSTFLNSSERASNGAALSR